MRGTESAYGGEDGIDKQGVNRRAVSCVRRHGGGTEKFVAASEDEAVSGVLRSIDNWRCYKTYSSYLFFYTRDIISQKV